MLDLGLPPHPGTPDEGLATLPELLHQDRHAKVIIISGQSEKATALQAIGAGAYDFLAKPIQIEELRIILRRTFHVAALERDYREMQALVQADAFEGLIGTSPRMQEVFSAIRKVAGVDAPVLILGESGSGKEIAALALHKRSQRKNRPFTAINCGAIPENLPRKRAIRPRKARLQRRPCPAQETHRKC